VEVGDILRMVTPDGTFEYAVESTEIVRPKDVHVLNPTPEPVLTLVTCYPFNYIGHAPKRYIVKAKQIGAAATEPDAAAALHKAAAPKPAVARRNVELAKKKHRRPGLSMRRATPPSGSARRERRPTRASGRAWRE
jgi:hypothetical protein